MTRVIAGTERPEPPQPLLVRVLLLVVLRLVLAPWLLLAGGLLYVGIGSLFRKDGDDLWICLPAGLALSAVLVGIPLWLWCRSPRWVHEFRYAEGFFEYVTRPGTPPEFRPVSEIESATELRDGRAEGYLIRFRDGGKVALSRRVTNADQLYAALHQELTARR
jgi:hypothetical protein